MTSCKVCHLNKSKHSRKLWALHQQAQICALCQKNANEHSEKLWDMHKNAIEKGRFCPFHKKIEKPCYKGVAQFFFGFFPTFILYM